MTGLDTIGGSAARRRAGSDARLLMTQFTYEQRTYWRNPTSAIFTFALPLAFLFIFAGASAPRGSRASAP